MKIATLKIGRVLVFWVGVLCLGVGCVTTQPTIKIKVESQLKVQDYFPLRVGDRWVYRIRFARQSQTIEREVKIVRKSGNRFYDNQRQTYEYDAYGLRGQKRYLLKYPLQAGTRWFSVLGINNVERYVITGVNRTIQTPAGSYSNCIVVRSRDSKGRKGVLEGILYFAPRVGLAKIRTILETQGQRIPQWTLELVSYEGGGTSTSKAGASK